MGKFTVTYPKPDPKKIDKWLKDIETQCVELAGVERKLKELAKVASKAGKKIAEALSQTDVGNDLYGAMKPEEEDLEHLSDKEYEAFDAEDWPEAHQKLQEEMQAFGEEKAYYDEDGHEVEALGEILKETGGEVFEYAKELLKGAKEIAAKWKALEETDVEVVV